MQSVECFGKRINRIILHRKNANRGGNAAQFIVRDEVDKAGGQQPDGKYRLYLLGRGFQRLRIDNRGGWRCGRDFCRSGSLRVLFGGCIGKSGYFLPRFRRGVVFRSVQAGIIRKRGFYRRYPRGKFLRATGKQGDEFCLHSRVELFSPLRTVGIDRSRCGIGHTVCFQKRKIRQSTRKL